MADSKISALTAASALAGTEVLPVVQSGTTKKATVTEVLAAGSGTYAPVGDTFPFSYANDPRAAASGTGNAALGAVNDAWWFRAEGKASAITKIAIQVGVQSGNISVGTATSAAGRANPTTRTQTSGAVACPASGYAEVALGGSVTVSSETGWYGISADNTTATFKALTTGGTVNSQLALGFAALQNTSHPLPASPAPTASMGRSYCMVGVA